MVKTKIICTLGPASSQESVVRKMMLFGMDVVRLNFSHSTHQDVKERIALVRKINKKYRRHIRILGDLEGNRIRIGKLINGKPIQLLKRKNTSSEQYRRPFPQYARKWKEKSHDDDSCKKT